MGAVGWQEGGKPVLEAKSLSGFKRLHIYDHAFIIFLL